MLGIVATCFLALSQQPQTLTNNSASRAVNMQAEVHPLQILFNHFLARESEHIRYLAYLWEGPKVLVITRSALSSVADSLYQLAESNRLPPQSAQRWLNVSSKSAKVSEHLQTCCLAY